MKRRLFIYGAGGLGKEVCSLVRALDDWEVAAFLDDTPSVSLMKGVPVIPAAKAIAALQPEDGIVLAIGDPFAKRHVAFGIKRNVTWPVLVHPAALIQERESVLIGAGTIVCAGAILTTDISLGEHVLINLGVTIGHDAVVGSFTSVMPGVNVAGEVRIGDHVLLGSGCNIRNRVTVGSGARVGMGAVVIRDVPEGKTVVGVPAR